MKKTILLLTALTLILNYSFGQQGEGISYQAALRNSSSAIAGKVVTMQFTIIDDSVNGTVAYRETQSVTTTSLGIVNCTIGKGTASTGVWKNLSWAHNPMYINAQVDTTGGTVYVDLGTTQLQASSFAKTSGGVTLFQNGTSNPTQMIVSHSPAYPTWGIQYNDTTDVVEYVAGGSKTASVNLGTGSMATYYPYGTLTKPYSSNAYGNVNVVDNITTGNKVQRGSDTSNMLAIAWGTISSTGSIVTSGGILNASNNVSVAAHTTSSGIYDIAIAGETYAYQSYTTIISTGGAGFISWGSLSGNLRVFTYNTTGTLTDQFFTFVIFKK